MNANSMAQSLTGLAKVIDDLLKLDQVGANQKAANDKRATLAAALDLEQFPLDVTTVQYCAKTGQPVGTFNENQFLSLVQLHGKDRALEYMLLKQRQNVAAHWLDTGPDSLQQLQTIDPYGYCVYALIILLHNSKEAKEQSFVMRRIQAYKCISQLDLNIVAKLNETLRMFNTLIQRTYLPRTAKINEWQINRLLTNSDAELLIKQLKTELRNCLQRSESRLDYIRPHDVANLRATYKGHSNFAGTKRQKQTGSVIDSIAAELSGLMGEARVFEHVVPFDLSSIATGRERDELRKQHRKLIKDAEARVKNAQKDNLRKVTKPLVLKFS